MLAKGFKIHSGEDFKNIIKIYNQKKNIFSKTIIYGSWNLDNAATEETESKFIMTSKILN